MVVMAKGIVRVKVVRCKGCGICVSVCPHQVLQIPVEGINEMGYAPVAVVRPAACTGCAMCALMCPDQVLTVEPKTEE
jgi:2-oxoglutarate ferredoxin oxidoreductase subunit delta